MQAFCTRCASPWLWLLIAAFGIGCVLAESPRGAIVSAAAPHQQGAFRLELENLHPSILERIQQVWPTASFHLSGVHPDIERAIRTNDRGYRLSVVRKAISVAGSQADALLDMAENGHWVVVYYLLADFATRVDEHGDPLTIDLKDPYMQAAAPTVLQHAAKAGIEEVVRLLAPLDFLRMHDLDIALANAIIAGHEATALVIVSYARMDSIADSVLHSIETAIEHGRGALMETLLQLNPGLMVAEHDRIFRKLAAKGSFEFMQLAINALGVAPQWRDMGEAIGQGGNVDFMKAFLRAIGMRFVPEQLYPVFYRAVENCQEELVRFMAQNLQMKPPAQALLHAASCHNVNMYLRLASMLPQQVVEGTQKMMVPSAIQSGNVELVRHFLRNGLVHIAVPAGIIGSTTSLELLRLIHANMDQFATETVLASNKRQLELEILGGNENALRKYVEQSGQRLHSRLLEIAVDHELVDALSYLMQNVEHAKMPSRLAFYILRAAYTGKHKVLAFLLDLVRREGIRIPQMPNLAISRLEADAPLAQIRACMNMYASFLKEAQLRPRTSDMILAAWTRAAPALGIMLQLRRPSLSAEFLMEATRFPSRRIARLLLREEHVNEPTLRQFLIVLSVTDALNTRCMFQSSRVSAMIREALFGAVMDGNTDFLEEFVNTFGRYMDRIAVREALAITNNPQVREIFARITYN